jgi:hypothetical protein
MAAARLVASGQGSWPILSSAMNKQGAANGAKLPLDPTRRTRCGTGSRIRRRWPSASQASAVSLARAHARAPDAERASAKLEVRWVQRAPMDRQLSSRGRPADDALRHAPSRQPAAGWDLRMLGGVFGPQPDLALRGLLSHGRGPSRRSCSSSYFFPGKARWVTFRMRAESSTIKRRTKPPRGRAEDAHRRGAYADDQGASILRVRCPGPRDASPPRNRK